MLQEVAITDQLNWLKQGPFTSGQGHWLPDGFDAYLKLLLPVGIDYSIPLEEYSPKRSTVAEMNARAAFWRKYDIGGPSSTADKLTPIKYSELAKIWDVPYDKDFTSGKIIKACGEWPPNLRESNKLTEQFIQVVTQIVGPSTPTYFSGTIENGDYHWVNDLPTDWIELGIAADLVQVYQRDGQFPGDVFDTKHTWCLSYMEFTDYLILGCSAAIAQEISNHPEIESFRL